MSKCFGDNHAKAFRMGREHKKVRVEEGRLLHSMFDRTCEGNHFAQAGSGYCLFYLLLMACFVGSGDPQEPTIRPHARPSLN